MARSIAEIDREIATRTEKVDAMGETLVELDAHPGLAHVKRYPPTGRTAVRWAEVEPAHVRLWEGLNTLTSTLATVRSVRARRGNPGDADMAELTRLLFERAIEVARRRIPLAQRTITSRAEIVESEGLSEIADRMAADYRTVVEFLDEVDQLNSRVIAAVVPLQSQLDRVGAPSPQALVDLLGVSATDPLSLTPQEVDRRVAIIAKAVADQSAELAELAALQANWPAAIADEAGRLDALATAIAEARQVRDKAQRYVLSGPLPEPPDHESELRAVLATLTAPDPAALRALRQRITEAQRAVAECDELARGLLDRRDELSGRLTAYQAKAARLGLGEDTELLSSGRIAAGLLSRRPCDLREVTRAIADYQHQLTTKREAT